jgi:2-polyprenyl-3-methyl-5-hydroxy-6-metoxy-1,4-benzoquinol methylase
MGFANRSASEFFSATSREFGLNYLGNPDFAERMRVWKELICKYSDCGQYAIDIGCGTGELSVHMAGRGLQVTGIDGAEGMIGICNAKRDALRMRNLIFIREELPFVMRGYEEIADLIVCSSVLEYIEPLQESSRRLSELLRPGGVLMVSMPNNRSVYRKILKVIYSLLGRPIYYRFVRNTSVKEKFEALLESQGFTALESAYYGNGQSILSKACRSLHIDPKYYNSLFVTVFRKRKSELCQP